MSARIVLALALLLAGPPVKGQSRRGPDERKITIYPAPISDDPLKYRLLPAAADQMPGNAATAYLAAFGWAGELNAAPTFRKLEDLPHDAPLGNEGREFVDAKQLVLDDLLSAGRRSWCVWDLPFPLHGQHSRFMWLDDARTLASLMSLAARVRIEQRQFDQALLPLRAGLALADNLGREPFAVPSLVAIGIQSRTLDDISLFIQQPGAPNLYWPLADIPALYRERGRVLENEAASLLTMFPELKHPERLTAEQTRALITMLQGMTFHDRIDQRMSMVLTMIHTYPTARKSLHDSGVSAATVGAMPANTVVLAYWVIDYQKRADELRKWAGLPLWQAYAGEARVDQDFSAEGENPNPLLQVLPLPGRLMFNFALVERERGVLQTVEAIRAYAAAHQGHVPRSLDELSPDTPAPLDPLLGKAFEYQGTGDAATLRAPAPPGENPFFEKIFRITVAH